MLDLQFLPHLVVTNPYVRQVYNTYYHAFETLQAAPPVTTMAENRQFTALLESLLEQHGTCTRVMTGFPCEGGHCVSCLWAFP
jgi:Mitochondrial branched-chain alpha-ketoacid dehydrogenase kinase